jgi:thiol-disulfide isomerase/thioredoxin
LLLLDRYDSESLQINFDVDLYDIECRNVKVTVFAQGGEERIGAISQDFWLRPVDQRGHVYGMAITPKEHTDEELRGEGTDDHQREMDKVIKEDGKAELDADWSDSHDGFKHKSFEHVIQAHDFTFINFFAGWCSHCQKFSPTWATMAKKVNGDDGKPMEFPDRDGKMRNVRMIKMNCVDFKQICQEKGIDAYPSIRLYKADGSFSVYEGKRDEADLLRWIERTVKMKSYGWASHHEAFERGCNAKGRMQIPRVPGRLELTAGGGDQNLNSRMTNVSHLVKHLSFSDPDDGRYHRKGWNTLPPDVWKHLSPLDGKRFVTTDFHQAWVHDMKVVSTVGSNGKTAYQVSHQKRLSQLKEDEIPQAQFHYDIEPFSIWVKRDEKKWYDFFTSLLAMLGGSFVVMRLGSSFTLATVSSLRHLGAPSRSKSGGELGY